MSGRPLLSAPPKTSDQAICTAVRRLLEAGGEAALSMQAIADAVGIRAPSLYKRFGGKADLLSAAACGALRELAEALRDAADAKRPRESLERMADVFRKFAKKNPRTYALVFAESMTLREDLMAARQAAVEPLLQLLSKALGKDTALQAARMLVSYLHGFLSMELSKTFRFGGHVNESFEYGLKNMIDCLPLEKGRAG